MSNFTPTIQQAQAVAVAKTRRNVVITAGAGTGKTSTLDLIARALAPLKGCYIAYNKAIATDAAAKFPANVVCRTAHSFAYRAVGHRYRSRLNGNQRLTGRQVAAIMEIERSFPLGDDRELAPSRVAALVMATVEKWCHSADERIQAKHAPVHDVPGAEEVSWELANYLASEAQRAWDSDLRHESGRLRFTHDMYVKLWALSNPTLPGDFILYDEAQDADPCIAGIVLAQKGKQLIAVGDECQAIYGWRGATDAMASWPVAPSDRVSLSESFRFGPAIAAEANVFLGILKAPLRITGHEPIQSETRTLSPLDASAILCRTNAAVIQMALDIHNGRKFAVVGGTEQIKKFAEAAQSLMQGRRASWHADLGAFKNWNDVLDYVNNDEGGSDLRSMVNVIAEYGVETIFQVCAQAVAEDSADVVLSTAHKAKGREWDAVLIAPDFEPSEDRQAEGLSRSEAMLMYVAVTRAKLALDCSALDWARGL